jgi:hypothetical protein
MTAPAAGAGDLSGHLTLAAVDLWVRRLCFPTWADAYAAGMPQGEDHGAGLLWPCASFMPWVRQVLNTRVAYLKRLEADLPADVVERLRQPKA